MTQSLTSFSAFLKTRYTPEHIQNVTEHERILYAKTPKDGNCSGEEYDEPIIVSNPQGIGATRAIVQTNQAQVQPGSNLIGKKWRLTFGDYKAGVVVDEKTIRASKDDMGSFLRGKGAELDGLLEALADHYAILQYGDSGHSLGSFTISSGVCTLVNPDDIVNFQIGMQIQASANDGTSTGHSLLGSGSIGYVGAVDINAGTFTVGSADANPVVAATPASWTGTMFAFRVGDFGGGATPNVFFSGLGAWLTAAAPSATSWYGLDRTSSPYLSGVRLSATDIAGAGIEQRLKRLVTRCVGRWGGPGPNEIYINPEKWQNLADSLESRGQRPLDGKMATFGYQYLQLTAGGKKVDVLADRYAPFSTAWALAMKYWKFRSYGPIIDILRGDGNEMLRSTSTDTYEVRVVSFPVFSTPAPSYSGRVALP